MRKIVCIDIENKCDKCLLPIPLNYNYMEMNYRSDVYRNTLCMCCFEKYFEI